MDRVRWHLRVKRYSIRTERTYVDWIRRFILFDEEIAGDLYRRIFTAAPMTSNRSLQLTAGRSDARQKIMKTHPLRNPNDSLPPAVAELMLVDRAGVADNGQKVTPRPQP
jgi:hypothetical protein